MRNQIALALERSLYLLVALYDANPPDVTETKTTEESSPNNGPDHEFDSYHGPG